jgi:hypothetical protein
MSKYVLDHHLEGERARLASMSRLLDPMHRRHVEALGIGPGARTLEVGCGNGSISAWLTGTAETAVCNGASPWAEYRTDTVVELRDGLAASGRLDDGLIDAFLAHCADPAWWTQTIAFTAVHARASES